ncbi:hypothetical protein [Muricoccus aerilatus]|uniref:hypothetical protein n=1 Tax=Muricoccus aerilatus TaxID=452982 RepID=UPI0005C14EB4|nr:hypothetical protein [Roseomonas aerilata]
MTKHDQQLIQQAAARALTCLTGALEKQTPGSPLWVLLVEALDSVEFIEAIADEARDAFVPNLPFSTESSAIQAQRLALTRALLCRRDIPERLQAA